MARPRPYRWENELKFTRLGISRNNTGNPKELNILFDPIKFAFRDELEYATLFLPVLQDNWNVMKKNLEKERAGTIDIAWKRIESVGAEMSLYLGSAILPLTPFWTPNNLTDISQVYLEGLGRFAQPKKAQLCHAKFFAGHPDKILIFFRVEYPDATPTFLYVTPVPNSSIYESQKTTILDFGKGKLEFDQKPIFMGKGLKSYTLCYDPWGIGGSAIYSTYWWRFFKLEQKIRLYWPNPCCILEKSQVRLYYI